MIVASATGQVCASCSAHNRSPGSQQNIADIPIGISRKANPHHGTGLGCALTDLLGDGAFGSEVMLMAQVRLRSAIEAR